MESTSERERNPAVKSLRILLYGTQGSGSIFPSKAERQALQDLTSFELLKSVFEDLANRVDESGRLNCTIEEILGGELDRKTLLRYLKRFPVPDARVYGGWTTCLRLETSDGYDIVFDCGSGFRNCAKDLQAKWGDSRDRHLYIFGSHSHLDHTEGFDQAAVCFDPRNTLHIYGNHQFLKALDRNLGIFSRKVEEHVMGVQTPIFYGVMPTKFRAYEITREQLQPEEQAAPFPRIDMGEPIVLGKTRITAFEVFHPAPCLAYRVEHLGKVFIFCTDHELRRGGDPQDPRQIASLEAEQRVRAMSEGADLIYRDGQYLQAEYDGLKGVGNSGAISRLDWGHSCIEDIQEMVEDCGVKRTLIGHHDPNRDWSERNWIDEALARLSHSGRQVELAQAETVIDL